MISPAPARRWLPRSSSSARLLLVASLGLIALAAWFAFASAFRSAANTRQLLGDYAAFAAWSFQQHLRTELEEASWITLNPVGHQELHRDRRTPPVERLPVYRDMSLEMCTCGSAARPASYFRFNLRDDQVTTAGVPLSAALRNSLPTVLHTALNDSGGRPHIGMLRLPQNTVAAYTLMPTTWGDTIAYGFTFDSAGLAAEFDSILHNAPLLPATVTRGRPNSELLALEVRNLDGSLFHRDARWPVDEREWPFIASETLEPGRGGFVLRLTLVPAQASSLLSGGLPRTPLPLLVLVGILGVVAATVAVAQLRREDELSRVRSNFVAGVSHELRTPLAQIRLFLDTLRLRRYDTEQEHQWLVGHLTRETTRLEHLVENVLSISRLERNAPSEVPFETLDLEREVAEAVTAFAPLAASRNVTFDLKSDGALPVKGDASALRQLLLNLLDNAVKFGPTGQQVELELSRVNGEARLTIADHGPGIPPDERSRIWAPYYRGSNPAVRAVGGSGIGLSIVRDATLRLGGTIAVDNNAGGGARFDLRFPVAPTDSP